MHGKMNQMYIVHEIDVHAFQTSIPLFSLQRQKKTSCSAKMSNTKHTKEQNVVAKQKMNETKIVHEGNSLNKCKTSTQTNPECTVLSIAIDARELQSSAAINRYCNCNSNANTRLIISVKSKQNSL